MPKNVKGDPLRFFNIHSVAKYQKTEEGPSGEISEKYHKAGNVSEC